MDINLRMFELFEQFWTQINSISPAAWRCWSAGETETPLLPGSFRPGPSSHWRPLRDTQCQTGLFCCWIFRSCRARHLDRSQRRTPRKATPRKFKEIEVSLSRPNLDEMESPEISPEISLEPSSSHQASRFDSQRTRPGRIETAEQKSLRLMRAARIRDERIWLLSTMWSTQSWSGAWITSKCADERMRERNWRQPNVLCFRGWRLLSWQKMWQEALLRDRWQRAARSHNFGDHYANRSKAHWQRAQKLVHKSMKESCRNMNDFRQVPWRLNFSKFW